MVQNIVCVKYGLVVWDIFRPVSDFNKGKKSEFYTRTNFSECKCREHLDINVDKLKLAAE